MYLESIKKYLCHPLMLCCLIYVFDINVIIIHRVNLTNEQSRPALHLLFSVLISQQVERDLHSFSAPWSVAMATSSIDRMVVSNLYSQDAWNCPEDKMQEENETSCAVSQGPRPHFTHAGCACSLSLCITFLVKSYFNGVYMQVYTHLKSPSILS